jgi:hypothetical protein
MPSVRRLAAILAADVAGYSRLMGADEEGTHERLKAHLGQLVEPKIQEHRGRVVKNTGDGLLAEFASVVDAVRCLWACFTVSMRRAKLDPLHAAALVSTGSLVIYLPIYLAMYGRRLAQIPLADITVQAMFQGVLVTIVSLLLYGRAVAILGASGGASFGALVPALSALIAIPLLREWQATQIG